MATAKKRINISVSKSINESLVRLAKRDQEPVASKAADLLALALDIEEDRTLDSIARKRDTRGAKWLSHGNVWRKKSTR